MVTSATNWALGAAAGWGGGGSGVGSGSGCGCGSGVGGGAIGWGGVTGPGGGPGSGGVPGSGRMGWGGLLISGTSIAPLPSDTVKRCLRVKSVNGLMSRCALLAMSPNPAPRYQIATPSISGKRAYSSPTRRMSLMAWGGAGHAVERPAPFGDVHAGPGNVCVCRTPGRDIENGRL
jgi:hypothetical protein